MLRIRGSALNQALRYATNGVIGIRREDKNEWERRVPLTPEQVKKLIGQGFKVLVQPSSIRAFSDAEYREMGAEIREDLSEAETILAVKEVPVPLLIPNTTYMMFSHTHKAQAYNMPLLDAIMRNNIRLIDFERISGSEGRSVKFGPFAGFAGTIDTLHALGLSLLSKRFATPFLYISHAKEYRSLESARDDLINLGNVIRTRGLPREIGPLTFVVTGTGSVSQAAQQILHHLPCQYVEASELKKLCSKEQFDNKTIYVTVVGAKDMVAPKDRTKKFDKADYYSNPENYEPTFHEEVAPYAKVIINGMYWEEKYPRLLTIDQTRRLAKKGELPTLVLGEITCDPYGSIEYFTKSTSIAHPLYCYDPLANQAIDMEKFKGQGPLIVGVDHLPAEFPMESSEFFGEPLVPLVAEVARSDLNDPLDKMQKQLSPEVFNGIITSKGSLTPNYEYISELRQVREENKVLRQNRNILFLGAGMVSGPAVEYLLKDHRNSVTLADMDVRAAEEILEQYAGDAAHAGRDIEGRVQAARAVSLDVSNKDNLRDLVSQADVVISLVPWVMHPEVMDICIDAGVPCVTASYVTPGVAALHEKAKAAGVTLLNEMGLDPGIDIMSTMQMLHDIRTNGGIVKSYESYCGALPEPESSRNCLGYKFSWSPKGVLLAAKRPCTFRWKGDTIDLDGSRLYDIAQPFTPFRGLDMEWVPNGNSLNYLDTYGLHDAHTVVRATLRYQGFSTVIKAMRELGILEHDDTHEALSKASDKHASWPSVLAGVSQTQIDNLPQALADKFNGIRERMQAADDIRNFFDFSTMKPIETEVTESLSGLRELKLLDDVHMAPKVGSGKVIDALADTLSKGLAFEPHEQDFVLMYHRIVADYPSKGETITHESYMSERGTPKMSGTAKTVGLPVAIGAKMVLDGVITKKGIVRPITEDVYQPVMRELSRHGVQMHETDIVQPLASQA